MDGHCTIDDSLDRSKAAENITIVTDIGEVQL